MYKIQYTGFLFCPSVAGSFGIEVGNINRTALFVLIDNTLITGLEARGATEGEVTAIKTSARDGWEDISHICAWVAEFGRAAHRMLIREMVQRGEWEGLLCAEVDLRLGLEWEKKMVAGRRDGAAAAATCDGWWCP